MQRAPTRRAPDGLSSDPVPQRQATTAAGRSAIPPPMPPRVPDADQLAVAQSLPLRRKTTKRVPNTRAAGQPDAMPLNRAATRRVPAGASARINYQSVQQGFKELYSPTNDNASVVPDVDIVFVPGLGAHPEESWKSSTDFNWAANNKKEGLARNFPNARMLLFQYESAWQGNLKVKQFLHDIALSLLVGLHGEREGIRERPIVFIGHSMGGLVIAKAITLADSRRDLAPRMFECIAGCAFFGTPFGGAPMAVMASMLGKAGEFFDWAKDSKLVEMMKPGNEALSDLRNELLRLSTKLSPKFEMVCFWETHQTKLEVDTFGPLISQVLKSAIKYEMVSEESATLPGVDARGLAANHRDLVRFSDIKDPRYQLVLSSLKPLINGAGLVVKSRLNSTRGIDQTIVNNVMELLNGAQVSKKRKILSQAFPPSSWISDEAEYAQWLDSAESSVNSSRGDALFICGPEGKGKTRATMAALQNIDDMIREDETGNHGKGSVLLAYFLCDPSADFNTAEDLLKSILRQLISQQPSLAVWAKHFVKKKGGDAAISHANLTVENLWQALQDTLTDEFIGRRVYIIINNLHTLSEKSDSTVKLLRLLSKEMQEMTKEDTSRAPVRWLFASRDVQIVEDSFKMKGIRLIDLEDSKYCDQVQVELRKTAHGKVAELSALKNYNRALEWFASTLIGNRASTSQWINLACIQLAELPATESDQTIRRVLKNMPQDLNSLLDAAWTQIFRANESDADNLREVLRTLILTVEDPTEEELGMLTGLSSSEEGMADLRQLVGKCRPLLVTKQTRNEEYTIGFMNIAVKDHLLDKHRSKNMLDMSPEEKRWQHGLIALRCLTHIKSAFDFVSEVQVSVEAVEEAVEGGDVPEYEAGEEGIERRDGDEEQAEEAGQVNQEATEGVTTEVQGEEGDVGNYGKTMEKEEGQEEEADEEEEDEEEEEEEDEEDEEEEEEEEEEDGEENENNYGELEGEQLDPVAEELKDRALPYAVRNWLQHASKETMEISEILSKDNFWEKESLIRYRWLVEFMRLKGDLAGFDVSTLSALHIAASVGFKSLVVALIQNGYADEVNLRDSLVNTPLHLAAYLGRADIVEVLLDHGAEIDDGQDVGAQTPLHMAALAGRLSAMSKLIARKANTNAVASDIGLIMNAAIYSGNPEAVELLVRSGVSLTVEDDSIPSPLALAGLFSDLSMFEYLIGAFTDEIPPSEFDKAFIKSAESGRAEVFNKLLSYDHPQVCYQAALAAAVSENNWEIVMTLLESYQDLDCGDVFVSAAVNADDQDRVLRAIWKHTGGQLAPEILSNALYEAADLEKEDTVRLLVEAFHIDPNATGQEFGTALTASANDGTMGIIHILLENGADVNSPNGWALQTAASSGHLEVVKELLDRGANVNALTTNVNFPQGTALQAAAESGHVDIVKLLLESHANPNLGAGEYTCPLIAAARKGEPEILKLLVDAKADVDVFGGSDNSTPLINAATRLPWSTLKVLLDAGADINLADHDGDTALIISAAVGDMECVVNLLDMGAEMFHSNDRGSNAMQAALEFEHQDCLKILVDRVSELMTTMKAEINARATKPKLVHINDELQAQPMGSEGSRQDELATNGAEYGDTHDEAATEQAATEQAATEPAELPAQLLPSVEELQNASDLPPGFFSGLPPVTVQQTWSQPPRTSLESVAEQKSFLPWNPSSPEQVTSPSFTPQRIRRKPQPTAPFRSQPGTPPSSDRPVRSGTDGQNETFVPAALSAASRTNTDPGTGITAGYPGGPNRYGLNEAESNRRDSHSGPTPAATMPTSLSSQSHERASAWRSSMGNYFRSHLPSPEPNDQKSW